jgi:hypothetical protein
MKLIRLAGIFSVISLARIGYVAKGLVFIAIGLLAVLALFGFAEGRVTGSGGAIHVIGRQIPGRIGFGLLAAGLAAHVFWRLYQAVMDPDGRGRSALGLVQRGGFVISAVFYSSMMLVALSAITGLAGNGERWQDMGDELVGFPGGRVILGLVGLGVVLTGGYQLYRAWSQAFRKRWTTAAGIGHLHGTMAWTSSYGIAVRGGLFLLLGWQLVRAGWFASSDQIIDVATALWLIGSESWGTEALALVASGLFLYGVYCLFNAAFRKIDPVPRTQESGS